MIRKKRTRAQTRRMQAKQSRRAHRKSKVAAARSVGKTDTNSQFARVFKGIHPLSPFQRNEILSFYHPGSRAIREGKQVGSPEEGHRCGAKRRGRKRCSRVDTSFWQDIGWRCRVHEPV